MIDNFFYSVLPFYDSVEKQNFRKEWMYGDVCTSPLITPKNRFLPFQFKRASRYNQITSIKLMCYNDEIFDEVLADLETGELKIITADSQDYILYYGNRNLKSYLACGNYYLQITDGIQTWYSEIFRVEDFVLSTVKKAAISVENPKILSTNLTAQNILSFKTE